MLGKTYEDMTLIQLREIAKEIGIKNITKTKKSELIEDIKLFKFNFKIKKRCRMKKFPHLFH